MRTNVVMLTLAMLVGATAAVAQKPGYVVWVDRVTVGGGGGDPLSRADYQVEIRRRDPAAQEKVDDLADQISGWQAASKKLRQILTGLQNKQKLSEVKPGSELTPAERERLAKLARTPLGDASSRDVRAFRALKEKEKKGQRQPGPPLTAAEAARLKALQDEANGLEKSIRAAKTQRKALLATIVGHTRKVSSDAKTVSFGSKPVLTIYVGDLLQVKVVDKDLFSDDVYGSHVFHVTENALRAGAVELGRTAGIRALRLRFRPAGR